MRHTDDILNSLDNLKRAEAPDHFYAGIRAKMARQLPAKKTGPFILRPVFISSVLLIFLLANIAALTFTVNTKKSTAETSAPITITGAQAFAQEYNLNVQTLGQ